MDETMAKRLNELDTGLCKLRNQVKDLQTRLQANQNETNDLLRVIAWFLLSNFGEHEASLEALLDTMGARLQPEVSRLLHLPVDEALDTLDDLNLSARTRSALRRAGLTTEVHLRQAHSEGTLLRVRNLGRSGVSEIVAALNLEGELTDV